MMAEKSGGRKMAIEKVRAYFAMFGMEERILEFDVSSATVELAAIAVGVEGKRIAKTLSFLVGDKPVLIAVAGDAKISNPTFKEKFHTKAKMLSFEQVEALIGHGVGGVCPFAIKENVDVYLDCSMQRFSSVFPAAGSASSAVELSCDELFTASKAKEWVDTCKLPE